MSPAEVVDAFMRCFTAKDLEGALALVADDVLYDNVPIGDLRGKEPMRRFLAPLLAGPDPVEFEVHRRAATGPVVFNERTDRLVLEGKPVAIPVAGVFEVHDGLITLWRDYFDDGMLRAQLAG